MFVLQDVKLCLGNEWQNLVSDFLDRRTALLKVNYFTAFAGVVILWVQLTPYQGRLGLTLADTGVISMVGSVMIIVGASASGLIGDRMGDFKYLTVFVFLLQAVVAMCLSLLQPQHIHLFATASVTNVSQAQAGLPKQELRDDAFRNDFIEPVPTIIEFNGSDFKEVAVYNMSRDESVAGGHPAARGVSMHSFTFWCYLLLHALFILFNSAGMSLYDSMVLCSVQRENINYGYQRCYGTLAALLSSLTGGWAVDYASEGLQAKDYRPVFYLSCGLCVLSAGLQLPLDLSYKNKLRREWKVPSSPALLTLLGTVALAGLFLGYTETYLYRYLGEMGASSALLGATATVGGSAETLLQLMATWLMDTAGAHTIMAASFGCYSIKFLGLYFLQIPELALVLEVLDAVSTGLFFTVAVMQLSDLVPCGVLASYRGLLGTVYMGIGKLVGAGAGTVLVSATGTRTSWSVMAGAALASCLLLTVRAAWENMKSGSHELSIQRASKEKCCAVIFKSALQDTLKIGPISTAGAPVAQGEKGRH